MTALQALNTRRTDTGKRIFSIIRSEPQKSEIPNPETGEPRKFKKYCFSTDFDLLLERPDNMKDSDVSEVSPLHLNSITQRLFSGEALL